MQIDFGEVDIILDGKVVRIHFFVGVMSYSRRIFAKAYLTENQTNWLDGIESAFSFFGGLPREIVCDNATSLVKDHYAPRSERFTDRFDWFCDYYSVIPVATSIRKPNSKGKVESAVYYVKHNALVNVKFESLEALNRYLENWSLTVCDQHSINDPFLQGPKTPAERWQIEKPALRPHNKSSIARARREFRTVDKNGLIRVDNAMYRVPDVFVLRSVQLVVIENTITVSCGEIVRKSMNFLKPFCRSGYSRIDNQPDIIAFCRNCVRSPFWLVCGMGMLIAPSREGRRRFLCRT